MNDTLRERVARASVQDEVVVSREDLRVAVDALHERVGPPAQLAPPPTFATDIRAAARLRAVLEGGENE